MMRNMLLCCILLLVMTTAAACGTQTAVTNTGTGSAVEENNGAGAQPTTEQTANDTVEADITGPSVVENDNGTFTVTHAWGSTELPARPERIISLHFSYTDELVALGTIPTGIAGSYNAEVLGYLADKVSDYTFVGNHQQPNLEVISSLKPDLIIANADVHGPIRAELEQIAPTIALYTNGYQDMEGNFDMLGQLLDKQEQHDQVIQTLNDKIAQTKAKIQGKPKVIVAKVLEKEFYIWMKTSYIATLLERIGAEYSFDEEQSNQQQTPGKIDVASVNLETLVQENPDYLVLYGSQADLDKWMNDSSFQTIQAVQNKHLLVVLDEVWALGKGPLSGMDILDEALPFFTQQ